MALAAVYKQFLAAPTSTQLADGATLNYITTTTSFKGSDQIDKHFTTSAKQLKKTKQEFLSVVEGQNVIAAEVDTVLEFATGGGAYLPGLDDNFVADRTVYLPIIHIVTFDNDGKIQQIRQAWDQGSLLKQLDVIGKSGRNWPIRDSTEQIKLIETSVKSGNSGPHQHPDDFAVRSRGNSTNVLRDPHASLALFAPREESDESIAAVISPRGGARPRQRDFTEILGDEPVESPSRGRSESPSKAIAPKAGTDKKFQPSRLFEDEDVVEESNLPDAVASPSRFIRPNPKKYSHFDFADDPEEFPQAIDPNPKTKHSSQWCFDDFNTPHKAKPSKVLQKQNVRHWGNDDDQVQESPVRKVAPVKPRRDAETHFEFVDDGTPTGEARAARPRGATHNNGLGLYKNNLYSEDGSEAVNGEEPRALGAITNLKDRGRDFEAHWQMTDSPGQPSPKPPVGEDRKKVMKMMDASWSNFDQSSGQKENKPIPQRSGTNGERGIHIGGDGMGGGKGTNRNWLFGDEDESQKTQPAPKRKPTAANPGGFNWDF
ncbi:uncharacterized protein GGS22DRAFT_39501 [Annulohypoxylon maeteangense]|uniref:uncharacterized protein n=1 Tax=Annulohypoxylon maeteangense TaxID=1927788 RepID=UPI00200728FC|nr:uncharacterized protein GGS22DRAFT_39501 [Annulohypoxylon maeteangense]KAI0882700.1 hypothetical protein GGS22DRAFT_39501 [Annulohypoxylon maeteangense]